MTLLGLLYSIAYVSGFTGTTMGVAWAVQSLTLPWVWWRGMRLSILHLLGAVFILYVVASASWSPRRGEAIEDIWHWILIGFAFVLGSKVNGKWLWRGIAIGVTVSSAVAVAQWFGWTAIPMSDWTKPSGLFYNNAVSGAVAALTIVGLMSHGLYVWIPSALPLLYLSHSRGAWIALAGTWWLNLFVVLYKWERVVLICTTIPVLFFIALWFQTPTDPYRLAVWSFLSQQLTWFGHGAGSLSAVYLFHEGQLFHIEHAHNDYLTLLYLYGLGCLPLALLVAPLVAFVHHEQWQILICGLIFSIFFWSLETPLIAFALAITAGGIARGLSMAWDYGYPGRLGDLHRYTFPQPFAG